MHAPDRRCSYQASSSYQRCPRDGGLFPTAPLPWGVPQDTKCALLQGEGKAPTFWLAFVAAPSCQTAYFCLRLTAFFLPHRLLLYIICQYWVSFHFTFLPLNASSSSWIFPPFTAAFFRWFGLSQAGTAGVVSKSRNVVMSIYCEAQFIAASFFG